MLYKGCCHCGANRFEFESEPISSAISCDCTSCAKSQLLWYFPRDNGTSANVVRGDDQTLTVHKSGDLEKYFCNSCGVCVKAVHTAGPLAGKDGFNIRALLDVNPYKLEIIPSSIKAEGQSPSPSFKFEGPVPHNDAEDACLFTGSCLCGAVRIAVQTPPLSKVEVKEDNCSICVRLGNTQIYPHQSAVSITGKENTKMYAFGRKFNGWPFCTTCGCSVYGVLFGPPKEVVERLPEARQAFVKKQLEVVPVNVRMLDGVDWAAVTVAKTDEGTEGYALDDW